MSVKKSTRLPGNNIAGRERSSCTRKKLTLATVMNEIVPSHGPSRGGPQNKDSKTSISSMGGGQKYRKLHKEGTPMSHFGNFDMEIGQHEIKTEINREVLKKVGANDGMKTGKFLDADPGFDFGMSECRRCTKESVLAHRGSGEGIQEEVSGLRRFSVDPDSIADSRVSGLTIRTESEENWIGSKKNSTKNPMGSEIPKISEFARIHSYNFSINAPQPSHGQGSQEMGVIDEDSRSERESPAMDQDQNQGETSLEKKATKMISTVSEQSNNKEEIVTTRPLKTQESHQYHPYSPPTQPTPATPLTPGTPPMIETLPSLSRFDHNFKGISQEQNNLLTIGSFNPQDSIKEIIESKPTALVDSNAPLVVT